MFQRIIKILIYTHANNEFHCDYVTSFNFSCWKSLEKCVPNGSSAGVFSQFRFFFLFFFLCSIFQQRPHTTRETNSEAAPSTANDKWIASRPRTRFLQAAVNDETGAARLYTPLSPVSILSISKLLWFDEFKILHQDKGNRMMLKGGSTSTRNQDMVLLTINGTEADNR